MMVTSVDTSRVLMIRTYAVLGAQQPAQMANREDDTHGSRLGEHGPR